MLSNKDDNMSVVIKKRRSRFSGFQLDWLGQMSASLLWASSVFAYGISSIGDILQLCAALAWMAANLATIMTKSENGQKSLN